MTEGEKREEKPVVDERPQLRKRPSAPQVRPSKADHYERLFQGGR